MSAAATACLTGAVQAATWRCGQPAAWCVGVTLDLDSPQLTTSDSRARREWRERTFRACLLTSLGLVCGSQPVVRDKDTMYEALYRIPCDPLTVKPCACTKQCVALTNISFTPDRPCTRKFIVTHSPKNVNWSRELGHQ